LSPPRTRFLCPLGNVEIAAAQIRTPVIFNRGFPPERKEKPNVDVYHRHGNTQVGRLRASYGSGFAQGCANDDKLSDVLAKLDERSLFKLVRDYKNGMLSIRLRTWRCSPQCAERSQFGARRVIPTYSPSIQSVQFYTDSE